MSDEYPREDELKTIEEWDFRKNSITDLLDFVRRLWKYDDRFVLTGKKVLRLYLSTGGWSGNESLIIALRQNFLFWAMCWKKQERGGHYWFTVRLNQFKVEQVDSGQ